MKILFKTIAIAVAGAAMLKSCNKDQVSEIYTPAEGDGMFSFNATTTAAFEFSDDNPVLSIDVYRSTTSGTATVQLTSTQTFGSQTVNVVDVPAELTFEDGSGRAVLSITANDNMEAATNYTLTISMGDESVSPGGNQSITLTVSQAYSWISLGMGQFYDNIGLAVDLDGDGKLTTAEELAVQEVEILKADGYDRWRIVNPWGNRDAVALSWGSSAVLDEYSAYWEFYLLEDGAHVRWDGSLVPGILYESLGEQIIYQVPSDVNEAAYGYMDENIGFISEGVVQLHPAASIENTTSWFGQIPVIVAFPGYELPL